MINNLAKELRQRGFDLCHPIHTSWYNNVIKEGGLVESGALGTLPEPTAATEDINGSTKNYCNALLIGNTKNAWPKFIDWLALKVERRKGGNENIADEDALADITGRFDAYAEESIQHALERSCEGHPGLKSCELFWSNGRRQHMLDGQLLRNAVGASSGTDEYHCFKDEDGSFLVSMQRAATTTGEYWHDMDGTKLCVHKEYGTWTAFRVVVVLGTTGVGQGDSLYPPPPLPPCPCPVSNEELKMAKAAFDIALEMSSSDGYGATVNQSWDEICKFFHGQVCSGKKWDDVPDTMKPWIQLRDSFSVGRERWKYSDAQLLYHYTSDPEILIMELEMIHPK